MTHALDTLTASLENTAAAVSPSPDTAAPKEWLTRHEAAAYITGKGTKISATTLGKFACIGGGPDYRRWGNRSVYAAADLDNWIKKRLGKSSSSTSEAANGRRQPADPGQKKKGRPPRPPLNQQNEATTN
jgi:hypothetical protein